MFITFEGIDGSGKSTQIKLLEERLERSGAAVDVFREPGGDVLSERIRALLLDTSYDIDPFAELLLFSAARAQLVSKEIRPGLKRGDIIICDRFFDSTTAYQGAGRMLGKLEWMVDFHNRVTGGLTPDRTYYIALPVQEALARQEDRSEKGADRMEKTGSDFFERVIGAYEDLSQSYPERIVKLDGTLSIEVLHDKIWNDIKEQCQRIGGTTVLG